MMFNMIIDGASFHVFCSGGMELLFGNEKMLDADVPLNGSKQLTVGEAMAFARDNLLTERPEMFMKGDSV